MTNITANSDKLIKNEPSVTPVSCYIFYEEGSLTNVDFKKLKILKINYDY